MSGGRSENLIAPKPGEVRNPTGRNQYTYRADFEHAITELLKGVYEFRRELIDDSEGEKAHCLLCNLSRCDLYVGGTMYAHATCVDQIDSLTRGQVIALVTVQRAMAGDEKMLPTVLDRLWPKVSTHEVSVADSSGTDAIVDRLASLATRRRTNGDGREPEPRGPNGPGGAAE